MKNEFEKLVLLQFTGGANNTAGNTYALAQGLITLDVATTTTNWVLGDKIYIDVTHKGVIKGTVSYASSNTGEGTATLTLGKGRWPTERITLTCTTAGASGAAKFKADGSISGVLAASNAITSATGLQVKYLPFDADYDKVVYAYSIHNPNAAATPLTYTNIVDSITFADGSMTYTGDHTGRIINIAYIDIDAG